MAGVTRSSTVTYLQPAISAFAGVAVLGEDLRWNQPVGGLVVLIGVVMSQGLLDRGRS